MKQAALRLKDAQDRYTGDGSTRGSSNSSDSDKVTTISPSNVHSEEKTVLRKRVYEAAEDLARYEAALRNSNPSNNKHIRAAKILVDLCRKNGGCYVKVGQHLANLDYLLPVEFTTGEGATLLYGT